jgi:hypothetical protein
MKLEKLIYKKVKDIIPEGSEKTIFFVGIDKTSYEVFFYSYINGKSYQCFDLAEQGKLDENDLDRVFAEVVILIKKSEFYNPSKKNIGTITLDEIGLELNMDYKEKDARWYRIKKDWERKNL